MEYSAGLIRTAQPSYAVKLLSIAAERNEAAATASESMSDNVNITKEGNITNKGLISALMGANLLNKLLRIAYPI